MKAKPDPARAAPADEVRALKALLEAWTLLGSAHFAQVVVGLLGSEYDGVRLRLGAIRRPAPPPRPSQASPPSAPDEADRLYTVQAPGRAKTVHAVRGGALATLCHRGRSGYPLRGGQPFDPGAVTCGACRRHAGLASRPPSSSPTYGLALVQTRRDRTGVHAARLGRGTTLCRRARARTLRTATGSRPAPFHISSVTCSACRSQLGLPPLSKEP